MSTQTQIQEKIESVYEPVREFYRKNKNMDYFPTALDRTHKFFTVMTEGNEIRSRINGIYRVKNGNKEYCYFDQQLVGNDYLGNEQSWSWTVRKKPSPVGHFEFVAEEGKILCTSIDHIDLKYTIEFDKENIDEIIIPQIWEGTRYYIDTGSTIYSSTHDIFLEDSIEDAVTSCVQGRRVSKN